MKKNSTNNATINMVSNIAQNQKNKLSTLISNLGFSLKKQVSIVLFSFLCFTANLSAQKTWNIDAVHSTMKFNVTHLLISEVEGSFKVYSGSIKHKNEDFTDALISFTVDANSINTDNEMRDNHLKSDDFFNAKDYPQLKFTSTSFKKIAAGKYVLEGDMTIRNVTKKIKLNVTYGGIAKDGYGNTKLGFKATTSINRLEYGLKWNALTESGGMTVGKEVEIKLNLQFVLAK
jgi:polyisoprenoid-binding protein YceI